MWSGGISNPPLVTERLTYLLFIKRLDELHTLNERRVARAGKPIAAPIFAKKQDKLRCSEFVDGGKVIDGIFKQLAAVDGQPAKAG